MVWSNRGPQATGGNGVDVVADGAFSPGDLTLNTVLDGRVAWETWGGTSRSTPVAVAATALVYQAWRQSHGGTIPTNFFATAKRILKSSAQDLGYETLIQGSGSVDAGRAVKVASGTDAFVVPGQVARRRLPRRRSTRSSRGRSLPGRATRRRSRSTGRGRGRSPTAT